LFGRLRAHARTQPRSRKNGSDSSHFYRLKVVSRDRTNIDSINVDPMNG